MEMQKILKELRPFIQQIIKTNAAVGCRVIRTSVQSIPDATETEMSWSGLTDTLDHGGTGVDDTNGMWNASNPTRLTCVTPGWYTAGGEVAFEGVANAYRHIVGIYLYNSSGVLGAKLAQNENHTIAGAYSAVNVSTGMFYMHAGDYINIFVMQTSGGAINTYPSTITSHIGANAWIARVA